MEPKENMEEMETNFQSEENTSFYTELVEKANELKSSTDWQYGAMEFENIRLKWGDGPAIDGEQKKELFKAVKDAQDEFFKAKKEHYEKLNDRRANNLNRREELYLRLKGIVDGNKWSSYNEVSSIQRKFEDIKPLPPEAEAQTKRFNDLIETFNEHKVEYLVKVRQKEEDNLLVKLAIVDKIKAVAAKAGPDTKDWDALDKEIEDLFFQWKKVGRVVKEKSDEIWNLYRSARDAYQEAKMQHNKKYRAELEKNVKAKTALCEKAEELLNEKDLALASKEMNILSKRWREAGPTPQDVSDALWERFKTSLDKFSEIRNENLDEIRDTEKKNLELKEALCAKAEELATGNTGAENHRDLIESLYKEWNEIGPVPKRKTRKIWARFKKAIDGLNKKRRDHFKQLRTEQKNNLTRKREIIDKITALASSEDKEAAAAEVKTLQDEFNTIGYVPIKQKDKVWESYRAACDTFYGKVKQSGSSYARTAKSGGKSSGGSSDIKQKQNELFKLKKECDKLNETILQYADTKTYIKPNKKGQVLIDEIQTKIDSAKDELNKKSEELENIRREIEELGN